jgi:hypothetical protein
VVIVYMYDLLCVRRLEDSPFIRLSLGSGDGYLEIGLFLVGDELGYLVFSFVAEACGKCDTLHRSRFLS